MTETEDVGSVGKSVTDSNVENAIRRTSTMKPEGDAGQEDVTIKRTAYVWVRIVECFCIAIFVFGFLWEGTEVLQLTFPEFMMLYGGTGALVSELVARLIQKQLKKKD